LSQTFAAFENMDNPYAIAHELLDGPNDARPSAEQVIQDQGLAGKLDDRTVLITGGTAGLGKESARVMQKNGAKVYITARTAEKGEKVARELNRAVPNSQPIEVLVADLSNLQSVRDAAKDFLSRTQTLNVLLNNAGVMACPEDRTTDGFEMQFGVNHVAHFLLFQLLKDTLLASSIPGLESRVVALSSSGHRAGGIHFHNYNLAGEYDPWKAYALRASGSPWVVRPPRRHHGHGIISPPDRNIERDDGLHVERREVHESAKVNRSRCCDTSVGYCRKEPGRQRRHVSR
jgi:hypothetical protein